MNISAYSIKNPVPAILLFGLLSVVGFMSFKTMQVQDFPDIELPVVTITASLSGATPTQMETDVVRKIEDAIASVSMIKHITSQIRDDQGTINVEFELEKNVSDAENDIRSAISRIRSDLPADIKEPVVSKVNISGHPIVTYYVTSKSQDEEALSWYVDNQISKKMLSVKGVGKVARLGGVTREIQVELDPDKMLALNVSPLTVSTQLKSMQADSPGGRSDLGSGRQTIRTQANVKNAQQLAAMQIPIGSGRYVMLSQIATIKDTFAERSSIAMVDGLRTVAFQISRTKGASEIEVYQRTKEAVAALNQANPGMQIQESFENITPIQDNFDGSMHLLYEGAILAVIVVWMFLKNVRATIVAAVALPLSVMPTFIGMQIMGFTLNTITLLSMALVVGILVDDAIVEIENIARHLRMGKSPVQAATEAADEIGMAVIATTFALVAVFMPTAFMSGVIGKFFKQFGWTAVFAILASLAVARFITPMMSAYFLKPEPETKYKSSRVMEVYLSLVAFCLRHRALTIIVATLFFFGSLSLIPLLPKGFVPAADRAVSQVNIELAPGSTLEDTYKTTEAVRVALQPVGEIRHIFSAIGSESGGNGLATSTSSDTRKATMNVILTPRESRHITQQQIEDNIRHALATIPATRITIGGGDTGSKMQLTLQSDEAHTLVDTARQVEQELRTLKGIGNVKSDASLVRPEISVKPDYAKAAELGITSTDIANVIRVATNGDFDTNLPKMNLEQRQVPIKVKLPISYRKDLSSIERLTVNGRNGPVMIGNIATVSISSGPAQIDRFDRIRTVKLEVELGQTQLGTVYAAAMKLPSIQHLPAAVKLGQTGDTQNMNELFASFGTAMLIGVLCIYAVLVLLFKDFMQPFTILMALPFSIGGAFLMLLITGKSFSMPSLIGLLMLMGIVSKNSILMVEYAIMARNEAGISRTAALIEACRKRAQPIIMTTIAMAAGMLPIALGMGADPSFRSPMAISVIGGLITSTLLSLVVIPPIFSYVDDAKLLLLKWFHRPQKNETPLAHAHKTS